MIEEKESKACAYVGRHPTLTMGSGAKVPYRNPNASELSCHNLSSKNQIIWYVPDTSKPRT